MKKGVFWPGFVTWIAPYPSPKVCLTTGQQETYENIILAFTYLTDEVKHIYLNQLYCKTANYVLIERKKRGRPI